MHAGHVASEFFLNAMTQKGNGRRMMRAPEVRMQ